MPDGEDMIPELGISWSEWAEFRTWLRKAYGEQSSAIIQRIINTGDIDFEGLYSFWNKQVVQDSGEPKGFAPIEEIEDERIREALTPRDPTLSFDAQEPTTPPTPTEPIAPETPSEPEEPMVRSFDGYDYQWGITGYDDEGNPIYDWSLIGRTAIEDTGIRERELAESARQFDISQQTARGQDTREQLRVQQAQEFETWKSNRLLELERGGPVNWMRIFQMEQAPNPFAAPQYTAQQSAEMAWHTINEARMAIAETGADIPSVDKFLDSPEAQALAFSIGAGAPEGSQARLLASALDPSRVEAIKAQRAKATEAETTLRETGYNIYGGGRQEPQMTPGTPAWMTPFVSTRTGEPLRQEGIRTPSGQAYGRLSPTQTQQLGGYMEYTGQGNLADLQELVRQNLPQPTRGTRFRAARSRV